MIFTDIQQGALETEYADLRTYIAKTGRKVAIGLFTIILIFIVDNSDMSDQTSRQPKLKLKLIRLTAM